MLGPWMVAMLAVRAWAAGSMAAAPASSVQVSSAATISSLYGVDRLRDPFGRWGSQRGESRPFSLAAFSIHKLSLRAVMKDASSEFALFAEEETGASFLLRQGRLYDEKGKAVPGISGSMNIKTKSAALTAADGDVQVFRLGSEEAG